MATPARRLTPDDLAAYAALRREMLTDSPWAFSSSPETDFKCDPKELAPRLTSPGLAIIGAFDPAGRLVGAAGVVRETPPKLAHRAFVWGVYVTPEARGRGAGDAIMREVIREAATWPGLAALCLSVSERAVVARRLYERHDFVAWGTEPDALHVDGRSYAEVHMRRAL